MCVSLCECAGHDGSYGGQQFDSFSAVLVLSCQSVEEDRERDVERERDIPHSHGHTAYGATAGLQVKYTQLYRYAHNTNTNTKYLHKIVHASPLKNLCSKVWGQYFSLIFF